LVLSFILILILVLILVIIDHDILMRNKSYLGVDHGEVELVSC